MAWKVVIAHAEGEEHHAERLANFLSGEGYEVTHRGTVLVGESFTEEASKALALGGPVVVCGTIKAVGTRWAHTLVRHVEAGHAGRVRVFPVRFEAEAYLEVLAGNVKVADCHRDFHAGVKDLLATLRQYYPIDERPGRLEHSIEDWADVSTKLSVYDASVLERFRQQLRPHIRERLPDALDDRNFLRQAGLLGTDGNLTRAGALIVGECPERVMPSARVACTHYHGVTRTAERELVPVHGPVPKLIQESLQFLKSRVEHLEQQTPGAAEPTIDYEYPMIAVREILANAFCHRRYDDHGRHVHVRLFADRIEVASPGEWVGQTVVKEGPIELSALVTESVRRNARLASVLAWAYLVEEEGSGVPRAVEDCLAVGARSPIVEQRDGFTVVSIWPRTGWRHPVRAGLLVGFDTSFHPPTNLGLSSVVEIPTRSSSIDWSRLRSVPIDAPTWEAAMDEIDHGLERVLESSHGDLHVLVVAPYAVAAFLGRRLGDMARARPIHLHQLSAFGGGWDVFSRPREAPAQSAEPYFERLCEPTAAPAVSAVLLAIDGAHPIPEGRRDRLAERLGAAAYHLQSRSPEPMHPAQMPGAAVALRQALAVIGRQHPGITLHIIISAPVALAIEIGRQLTAAVFPSAIVHHFDVASAAYVPVLDVVQRKVVSSDLTP